MAKRKLPLGTDRHHRLPRSRGGGDNPENISIVNAHKHRCYHTLFGNRTAPEVAQLLTEVWIDPEVELIAIPKGAKVYVRDW